MKKTSMGDLRLLRKPACFFTLLCLLFSLCGCFDLGSFEGDSSEMFSEGENYDDYYDSFGYVAAISKAGRYDYDIESSLFNERTVKELGWNADDGDEEVVCSQYVYVAIPVERDINIDDLVLYVKAEEILSVKTPRPGEEAPAPEQLDSGVLNISAFVLDSTDLIPEKVRYPGDSVYEEIEVPDESNPGSTRKKTVEVDYNDPPAETAVAETSTGLTKNEWSSFLLSEWTTEEGSSSTISLKEGNVLLLRFDNNSGWTTAKMPQCKFNFLNLLIRAVD